MRVSGSVRARYEAIDGQVRPGFEAESDLVNLRTTVFAEYDFGGLRVGGELYDSRAYGGDVRTPISTNEVNTAELVQAYVAADWSAPLGAGTRASVQAGRFLMNLGSRRLVAADDYRNTTNSYTGVRADLTARDGVKATAFYVLPQVRLPDGLPSVLDNRTRTDRESDDLVLFGGLVSKANAFAGMTVEGTYVRLEEQDAPGRPTRNRSLDTYGARLIRDPKPGALDGEVEVLRQTGSIRSGLGPSDRVLDVSAEFVHADVGYSFRSAWAPHVVAEFDYASGDDGAASYGRFDTLFGMRRADFAPAGLYNAVSRSNLVSPGLRLEVTPNRRWDAFVSGRLMWLASDVDSFATTGVRDPLGRSGDDAGGQIDGRVRWWVVPDRLRFEADGVWLSKGSFLRDAPNAPASGDASRYVSLNLTAYF
ncbi:hypothetical protein ASG17_01870 [Brevundimonas sp. Leaf363]|nr:hypothetical protein ASG17_01870 [Brevundimonas sp. Leaf363]